eukprot:1028504-Pyramimonas_sp.AAC.1
MAEASRLFSPPHASRTQDGQDAKSAETSASEAARPGPSTANDEASGGGERRRERNLVNAEHAELPWHST